ncbi:MAG: zf-HC2 domain-containing protein [candidate division KSB1 bacterium]|nr:zf-HC2 domain-containing protein [candidate division KSB1 bacterium]
MSLCNRVQKLFSAYYEGELAEDQKIAFEQHLEECPRCRENFSAFKVVCRRLKELPKPKPTPYFDAALYYRVRREQRPASRYAVFPMPSGRTVPVFVAAAVLLVFLGAQLQKAAMDKQIRDLAALNDLLRQNAEVSAHFVVTQIDTTANRIKVIKYINTRPAGVEWVNYPSQASRRTLIDRDADGYPDLRRAPRPATGLFSPQPSDFNGARVIQASQYQF